MATSCAARDHRLAARWWRSLAAPAPAGALALSPTGAVIVDQTNSLPYVAAAAAAGAAGHASAQAQLLAHARSVQHKYPTYYGGAWLALGETLLNTGQLDGCRPQGGSS
jgi:endoglucanase